MSTFYPDLDETLTSDEVTSQGAEECFFCEGGGVVLVARVRDLSGKVCELPHHRDIEIPCPWCEGAGGGASARRPI